MQRRSRLSSGSRISEIHQNGRSAANNLLVFRVLPNGSDQSRFCFIAGKRVGNAVVRNKIKRRLREVVRNTPTRPGWDTVIIARRGAEEAGFNGLEKAVHNLMRRTKIAEPLTPREDTAVNRPPDTVVGLAP
jgi:ribonuclease P protein component